MRSLFLVVIIIAGASFYFMKSNDSRKVDALNKEIKQQELKTLKSHLSDSVDKKLLKRIVAPESGDLEKEFEGQLSFDEKKELRKIASDLSLCLYANSCSDFKKDERYYHPNKNNYHRTLSKAFDLMRTKSIKGESLDLDFEVIQRSLKIQNSDVQASALMLLKLDEGNEAKDIILNNCQLATSDNIRLYLSSVSDIDRNSFSECFNAISKRDSNIDQFELYDYSIDKEVSKEVAVKLLKTSCKASKGEDITALRQKRYMRTLADKYDLDILSYCP